MNFPDLSPRVLVTLSSARFFFFFFFQILTFVVVTQVPSKTALHSVSAIFQSWFPPSLPENRRVREPGRVTVSASRLRSFPPSTPFTCISSRTKAMKHLQRIMDIGILLSASAQTILLPPRRGEENTVRLAVLLVRNLRCSLWL